MSLNSSDNKNSVGHNQLLLLRYWGEPGNTIVKLISPRRSMSVINFFLVLLFKTPQFLKARNS